MRERGREVDSSRGRWKMTELAGREVGKGREGW
jgi:hypothetical protein